MRYKLGAFLLIAGIVFTFFDGIYYLMIKKEYFILILLLLSWKNFDMYNKQAISIYAYIKYDIEFISKNNSFIFSL